MQMLARCLWLTVGLVLAFTDSARAGLYNPAEPPVAIEKDLSKFLRAQLADLRALGPPDPLAFRELPEQRKDYLAKVQRLRDKQAHGRLTTDELASLGAYLIRLRRTRDGVPDQEEAIQVLEAARREHPRNFYVLANLGTAYQLTGRLDAAESCLQDAEALAPEELRSPERFHLLLVRQRHREQLTLGLAPLDTLFFDANRSPVRYVGESGQWRVGELAEAEKKKLPGGSVEEAIAIVQQLLLWFPDDARLLWQLGELANAQGDLRAAHLAMNSAVYDFRLSTPELKRRRVLLDEAVTWKTSFERIGDWDKQRDWLLGALSAGVQGVGPNADLGPQAIWQAYLAPKAKSDGEPVVEATGSPALAALSNLDWRGWAIIGGGAGLVVLFLSLQVRQFLRRRDRLS
jgi:tetratricopeptide (TPR) repeat protein